MLSSQLGYSPSQGYHSHPFLPSISWNNLYLQNPLFSCSCSVTSWLYSVHRGNSSLSCTDSCQVGDAMVSSDQIIECAHLSPGFTSDIAWGNAFPDRITKISQHPHCTAPLFLLASPSLTPKDSESLPTVGPIFIRRFSSPDTCCYSIKQAWPALSWRL